MLYGDLKQRNPTYSAARWRELDDLYAGGYQILDRIGDYLPRLAREHEEQWRDRKDSVAYISYLGQIVDYFASQLFSQELTMQHAADASGPTPGGPADPEYYGPFQHDADRCGHSLSWVLRQAFISALVKKRAIIGVDFPRVESGDIATRADEDALGANRAYLYPIPIEQLIDWEKDEHGRYAWAILHRDYVRRDSPEARRDLVRHEFKIWRANNGDVRFQTYRLDLPANEKPEDSRDVPLVDEGVTSFPRIPLIDIEISAGLWVGNKIGPLAKEHLQRRSTLISSENRSLITIPVVYLGSEYGSENEPAAMAQQNPNRGRDPQGQFESKGFMVLGKGDKLAFEAPDGRAFDIADRQLSELRTEMFRIVERMAASVDNSAASTRRSGDSKKQDRAPEAVVLGAMGATVRDAAMRVFSLISESRGETIIWTPHGLDSFDTTDRDALIKEAVAMQTIDIPSPTWRKSYATQVAFQLTPNLPPDTQVVIRQEIEDGMTMTPRQVGFTATSIVASNESES